MKASNRELVDRLAAEYVLGTLRARARRRFERWLVSPQVMQMVNAWEERLAGLEPSLQKITPPARVWQGIESRLQLGRSGRTRAVRWMALAASALLAVFGYFALRGPSLEVTQYASIAADLQTIYWRVELLGDNQELRVQVQSPHALDAGKALELWILPAEGNPVSLGLLPASGEQRFALSAAQRAALAGAKQLAVSLEPSGGSPTGLPTGPVLHVAPLSPA
jgi:anti-sigma-K factor RskA